MGSKTETHTDLFANRMLGEEDGLYGKELVRVFAQIQDMSPEAMLPVILNDTNTFFNEAVFKTMGASAEVNMTLNRLSEESVLAYVKQHIDPNASEIVATSSGVHEIVLKGYDALTNMYPTDTSCVQHFYENLTLNQPGHYYVDYPTFIYEGKRCGVKSGESTSGITPYLTIYTNGNSTKYQLTLFELDGGCGHNGVEHMIDLPEDNRAVIAIEYKAGSATKYTYSFTEGMIREAESDYSSLMLMLKKDFEIPEEDKYTTFLYNRFGLGGRGPEPEDGEEEQPTLEESIANAEHLKDAFITYAGSMDDELFGPFIADFYSAGNEVTCDGEIFFEYQANSGYIGELTYRIIFPNAAFNASKQDDNGNYMPLYIVPVEELRKLSLPRKFEAYNRMFSMWGYSEQEVEIKWYQTAVFRVIMMIVGAILAWFTFGIAGLVMYGLMQVAMKVLAAIDPRLAAIVGLVVGLIMMDTSMIFNSVLSVTNNILAVIQTFNQVAFAADMKAIQNKTDDFNDKKEEAQDEIDDMKGNQILLSFSDKVDYLYNGNMEAAYMAPQMIAQSVNMSQIASVDKYYT